jgi:hypothetical protein
MDTETGSNRSPAITPGLTAPTDGGAAPLARAFHRAATHDVTPGHFLAPDTMLALEIASNNDAFLSANNAGISLPRQPSERVADLWNVVSARRTIRSFSPTSSHSPLA